jgi:cysteine-rich repeat protein
MARSAFRYLLSCLATAPLWACTDDTLADSTTAHSTESPGDGDGDTTGDGDGDGDTTTGDGDGDGDGDPAECGNGIVEVGEVCDDANPDDTDFCTSACTSPCGLEWIVEEVGVVTTEEDPGGELAVDADGNLVFGSQRTTNDARQAWIAKVDPTATTMMWETAIVGPSGDSFVGALDIADDGDVYVVGTRVGTDGDDIFAARLAGDTGTELWAIDFDGMFDGSDDLGTGVALATDGVVVVGTIKDVDQDSDISIRKLDFDGNELWATRYSGALAANGYSLDEGGPARVADDGTIYVFGHIYVDFETRDVVLLSYASDGTGPDWELFPHSGGTGHRYLADALALDGAGSLYLGMSNLSSPVGTFYVDKVALDTGTELWSLSNADIAVLGEVDDWVITDITAHAQGFALLGIRFVPDQNNPNDGRYSTFVGQFDGDGAALCYGEYLDTGISPDTTLGRGVALSSDGHPVVLGWIPTIIPQADRWLGQFGLPL